MPNVRCGQRAFHEHVLNFCAPAVCPPHFCLAAVAHDSHRSRSHTIIMVLTTKNDSTSIFKDGKLKSGTYKIQNIVGQTYVDIREHNKELCCRPATILELEGKGLVSSLPHLIPGARTYDCFH